MRGHRPEMGRLSGVRRASPVRGREVGYCRHSVRRRFPREYRTHDLIQYRSMKGFPLSSEPFPAPRLNNVPPVLIHTEAVGPTLSRLWGHSPNGGLPRGDCTKPRVDHFGRHQRLLVAPGSVPPRRGITTQPNPTQGRAQRRQPRSAALGLNCWNGPSPERAKQRLIGLLFRPFRARQAGTRRPGAALPMVARPQAGL